MTMLAPPLQKALSDLATKPPAKRTDCAQAWATAIGNYLGAVTPTSTTAAAAVSTLASSLDTAFQKRPTQASPTAPADAMDDALQAYAATVGSGMVGFTATPPPMAVGFATIFKDFSPTHDAAATKVANAIAAWAITGKAVQIGSGTTTFWL